MNDAALAQAVEAMLTLRKEGAGTFRWSEDGEWVETPAGVPVMPVKTWWKRLRIVFGVNEAVGFHVVATDPEGSQDYRGTSAGMGQEVRLKMSHAYRKKGRTTYPKGIPFPKKGGGHAAK